jgi:hypothetical protein
MATNRRLEHGTIGILATSNIAEWKVVSIMATNNRMESRMTNKVEFSKWILRFYILSLNPLIFIRKFGATTLMDVY